MSIAPGFGMASVPTSAAAGPLGAPFAGTHADHEPGIGLTGVVRLQPGDRILVHVSSEVGISGGGASKLARRLIDELKLDEIGFDVPVVVIAPGLRVEVLRPS
jgi:hypothetical protein